tara:strand:+ start:3225 stop:3962 length:738 start_codon:yes stop_codon:yes gene_type:complete
MSITQNIKTGERTLDDFKARLYAGGARPNLFEVELYFPTASDFTEFTASSAADASADKAKNTDKDTANATAEEGKGRLSEDIRFLVKGAQLPGSNINSIEVPFRGRTLKIAGDRTFDSWTVTVLNNSDFNIRDAFERWMSFIAKHDSSAGTSAPASYQKDALVHQLGVPGISSQSAVYNETASADLNYVANVPVLRSYKFFGVFPTAISPIDLSYDTTDTLEEFTVELQVQYWKAYSGKGNLRID